MIQKVIYVNWSNNLTSRQYTRSDWSILNSISEIPSPVINPCFFIYSTVKAWDGAHTICRHIANKKTKKQNKTSSFKSNGHIHKKDWTYYVVSANEVPISDPVMTWQRKSEETYCN